MKDAEASPRFFKTQDSDEWVRQTFHVQKRYSRVLVVAQEGSAPTTVSVPPLDLNARPGQSAGEPVTYKVAKVFTTLQAAADETRGGDLVVVMPGVYDEVQMFYNSTAGDDRYIHFKALGRPGEVTIRYAGAGERTWKAGFRLTGASYVIVEGFNFAGSSGPGLPRRGSMCGMFVGGGFPRTGRQTHHVALIRNYSHHHWNWGLHAVESHSVLLQDNCFAFSAQEHAAYVSNGSDNYVIRRNVFFGSTGCGLQGNMDADCCFGLVLRHEDMAEWRPYRNDRTYVAELVAAATKRFGRDNFMDGRGVNYIIEENVVNGCGESGGAAFNLAGIQDSLIQNNLAYGNLAHGIALYDDSAADLDREICVPAPSRPEDVKGPESLPTFGSNNNIVRNNTVLMDVPDRFGLSAVNGCYGNRMRNNLVINVRGDAIHVTSASLWQHDSGYNVANTVRYTTHYSFGMGIEEEPQPMPEAMKSLAVHLDETHHSVTGVTMEKVAAEFVRYGQEPWVIFEDNWWRLNPKRPDFHPKAGSKLLSGRGDAGDVPARDACGEPRRAADIGAFRAAE